MEHSFGDALSRRAGRSPVRAIVLGSGTSTGVPVIGCTCAVCTGKHPKNQRTRASIAVEKDGETILIDTSPEMRLQVLRAGIHRLRAVLYTHLHADHAHGFDDLRAFFFQSRQALDVYLLPEMIPELRERFRYAFEDTGYLGAVPQLTLHAIPEGRFQVGPFAIDPVRLPHGHLETCGFRFDNFAYATDFKIFPQRTIEVWRGSIHTLLASGIHFGQHPTHSVIPETLELFRQLEVRRGVISHLAHQVDYEEHSRSLPPHVELAFDGMTIDLPPTSS
jgi:phosphoribosyl 1,2-cyclic phosphate phosphodiesterase